MALHCGTGLQTGDLLHRSGDRCHGQRRTTRRVLAWFVAAALVLHTAAIVALDAPWPNLRDPEYGMRLPRLRARLAEHPERPLVLIFGSSRTCMGVKPAAWEAVRPGTEADPLLFNFGTVGAGPIQQLIAVRRLYTDGVRPAVVLLEYWPPALRQDGPHSEQFRVGRRLRFDDLSVVRDYFTDPDRTERDMLTARVNSLYANRDRLLLRVLPKWYPSRQHRDAAWREMDQWGYLPGMDVQPDDAATRRRFAEHFRADYRIQFDGLTIHADSDRALREAVALLRSHGVQVGFVYLPESHNFQSWYPPEVEKAAQSHFAELVRELNVPAINARNWMDDSYLADGFHLSRVGSGAFTERLGPAIAAAFRTVGGQP